jgi:hypothetical protein
MAVGGENVEASNAVPRDGQHVLLVQERIEVVVSERCGERLERIGMERQNLRERFGAFHGGAVSDERLHHFGRCDVAEVPSPDTLYGEHSGGDCKVVA